LLANDGSIADLTKLPPVEKALANARGDAMKLLDRRRRPPFKLTWINWGRGSLLVEQAKERRGNEVEQFSDAIA
jgi:hypothetical protein